MNLCCASEEFRPRCAANQFSNSNAQRVTEAFPSIKMGGVGPKTSCSSERLFVLHLESDRTQSTAHHSRCLHKGFTSLTGAGVTCRTEECFTGFLTPAWAPVRLDMCLMFGFSLFLCLAGTLLARPQQWCHASAEAQCFCLRCVCNPKSNWAKAINANRCLDRGACCSAGHAFNLKGYGLHKCRIFIFYVFRGSDNIFLFCSTVVEVL